MTSTSSQDEEESELKSSQKIRNAAPGAWRPISLTSFLLKTMEGLVDWRLKIHSLEERLKNAGQCAYLKGASTERALHMVVTEAEKALQFKGYTLSVMLDIEGAFSHATTRSMVTGMEQNELPPCLIRWVKFMLQ